MQFFIKHDKVDNLATDCLLLPIFNIKKTSSIVSTIDKCLDKEITNIIKRNTITGKAGEILYLPKVTGIAAKSIMLICFGDSKDYSVNSYVTCCKNVVNALNTYNIAESTLVLPDLINKKLNLNVEFLIKQFIILLNNASYKFKFNPKGKDCSVVNNFKISFNFNNDKTDLKLAKTAISLGAAIGKGVNLTKELANMPANVCNPIYLAQQAKDLAKTNKNLTTKILTEKDMRSLNMGALLGVAQGSVNPPRLIILDYAGSDKKVAPIVLVGKGITFDTGGNSLKSPANMIGMKYDMCGGAAVFGIIKAVLELKLSARVVGIIAAAENMPGGNAIRPDDILTTMSGQTVEVLNTDAEGRLVLCDALTYAKSYQPKMIMDMATLTGACVVALGRHFSGLYSNNDQLAKNLHASGEATFDRLWRMPLDLDYHQQLESNFADMANIGGPEAGSVTAACFLEKFVEKNMPWAHIDIAGSACKFTGKDRDASGRPVPAIIEFLFKYAN